MHWLVIKMCILDLVCTCTCSDLLYVLLSMLQCTPVHKIIRLCTYICIYLAALRMLHPQPYVIELEPSTLSLAEEIPCALQVKRSFQVTQHTCSLLHNTVRDASNCTLFTIKIIHVHYLD